MEHLFEPLPRMTSERIVSQSPIIDSRHDLDNRAEQLTVAHYAETMEGKMLGSTQFWWLCRDTIASSLLFSQLTTKAVINRLIVLRSNLYRKSGMVF